METTRDSNAAAAAVHFNVATVDDDDPPTLSSHAIEALKQFLEEKNRAPAAEPAAEGKVELVKENWNLSQFWYDKETADTIANEVISLCNKIDSPSIACIACPTLYAYLKNMDTNNVPAQLLEYDKRFEQYGAEFTFYDYNQPMDLPDSLNHSFSIIIADPPYLSKECLEKVAQTISFLVRPGQSYLLLLTGEVQRHRAEELLGLHPCGFRPCHSSKLGNEFCLFTNYNPGLRLGGWEQEQEQEQE